MIDSMYHLRSTYKNRLDFPFKNLPLEELSSEVPEEPATPDLRIGVQWVRNLHFKTMQQ